MSIRNIQNPNIPDNKSVNKTEKSDQSSISEKSRTTEKTTSVKSDRIEISGKKFADDIAFAKSVLSKIDEKQLDSLQQIRKNIDRGVYDSNKVSEEVGKKFKNDLFAIESFIRASSDSEESSKTGESPRLPDSRVEFLTKNEDVMEHIAQKIQDDLKNL